MPTYVYKCSSCSAIYEINRPVECRDDSTQCGECNSDLKRLFTAPAVTFKGGGFYRNDSRLKHKSASVKVGGNGGKES